MKYLKYFLIYMISLSIFTNTTYASFISTQSAILEKSYKIDEKKEKIKSFLLREDVIKKFNKMGIDIKDAQDRVSKLSDEEVEKLYKNIDNLPAGGNGVVGAIVLIFLILLITDILGYTKVFSFTRSIQ